MAVVRLVTSRRRKGTSVLLVSYLPDPLGAVGTLDQPSTQLLLQLSQHHLQQDNSCNNSSSSSSRSSSRSRRTHQLRRRLLLRQPTGSVPAATAAAASTPSGQADSRGLRKLCLRSTVAMVRPTCVNAKQYRRIIKQRDARAWLEAHYQLKREQAAAGASSSSQDPFGLPDGSRRTTFRFQPQHSTNRMMRCFNSSFIRQALY